MQYVFTFLEGILAFISPCMLPMLPLYISYFAGQNDKKHRTITNSLFFVLGFTTIFIILGAFAGSIGMFINSHKNIVNIIAGIIIIIFGLNYMEVLKIPVLSRTSGINFEHKEFGIGTSFLFGIIFSISFTPCIGTFLGAALMLAMSVDSSIYGILMLFMFSMGIGIPFVLCAILIDKLKKGFDFIKKNIRVVNIISGIFLIILGLLLIFGLLR